MTVHRCEQPDPAEAAVPMFSCPECRAAYVLVYGKRYGFLWLKRDLVWRRVGWR